MNWQYLLASTSNGGGYPQHETAETAELAVAAFTLRGNCSVVRWCVGALVA